MNPEEIQSIRSSLSRIETALMGDPKMGNKGIVSRLSDAEEQIRQEIAWRENVKARLAVIATAVSLFVTAAIEWSIAYLNPKK